jgi:CrcB protein
MTTALLVALGAAVGAPARLLAGRFLDRTTHWGTLLANLLGSALFGWLLGHGTSGHALTLWGTGFCGAFTTYSSFAVQTVNRGGWAGLVYAAGTVAGCLAAAWAGYALGG